MATAILVFALAAAPSAAQEVTAAEKKAFLELLAKLPTKGEFYTAEAVTKAAPHTRVLLALTRTDIAKYDLYPFLALSRGLANRKEPRAYAVQHFGTIAHPTLKLFWASVLFDEQAASPEVVAYLRKALESKEDARTLSEMAGPDFENFKHRVLRAYEKARPTTVELVKRHELKAFPEYSSGFDYTNRTYRFAPGNLLYVVRPVRQKGELFIHDVAKGTARRLEVPQPKGFKPKYDFGSYFDSPVLSVNSRGDVFCRWTIEGNGDHALALLKKGSDTFLVRRVAKVLADCYVVSDPEGAWYLIQGGPVFTVHRVESDLKLTPLGRFAGQGFHTIRIADARFIARDVLHLFWGDVVAPDNHLRMRCIDFHVTQKKWLHDRAMYRLDQFVSSANEPTVLQLPDGSLHYLWRIEPGAKPEKEAGLYYQAEADGKTIKVSDGCQYRGAAVGDRVVVCYTREEAPEKVFFRVIKNGTPGPERALVAAKGQKHELWSKYMVLHHETGRLWFTNTLTRNTLYELKLKDANGP